MARNSGLGKDGEALGFRDILKKIATSEDGDLASFAEALLNANVEVLKEARKSASDQVKEIMDAIKIHISKMRDPREFKVEEKKIELEHQREMLKLQLEAMKTMMSGAREKAELMNRFQDEMYDRHLDALSGFWGIETKSKKLTALMLAKGDAQEMMNRLEEDLWGQQARLGQITGLLEGRAPLSLPAPKSGGRRRGPKTKIEKLIEMLDEED